MSITLGQYSVDLFAVVSIGLAIVVLIVILVLRRRTIDSSVSISLGPLGFQIQPKKVQRIEFKNCLFFSIEGLALLTPYFLLTIIDAKGRPVAGKKVNIEFFNNGAPVSPLLIKGETQRISNKKGLVEFCGIVLPPDCIGNVSASLKTDDIVYPIPCMDMTPFVLHRIREDYKDKDKLNDLKFEDFQNGTTIDYPQKLRKTYEDFLTEISPRVYLTPDGIEHSSIGMHYYMDLNNISNLSIRQAETYELCAPSEKKYKNLLLLYPLFLVLGCSPIANRSIKSVSNWWLFLTVPLAFVAVAFLYTFEGARKDMNACRKRIFDTQAILQRNLEEIARRIKLDAQLLHAEAGIPDKLFETISNMIS